MDDDALDPRKKSIQPKNLEELSIEALNEYIAELESEIERARAAIEIKKGARMGADSLFTRK